MEYVKVLENYKSSKEFDLFVPEDVARNLSDLKTSIKNAKKNILFYELVIYLQKIL